MTRTWQVSIYWFVALAGAFWILVVSSLARADSLIGCMDREVARVRAEITALNRTSPGGGSTTITQIKLGYRFITGRADGMRAYLSYSYHEAVSGGPLPYFSESTQVGQNEYDSSCRLVHEGTPVSVR